MDQKDIKHWGQKYIDLGFIPILVRGKKPYRPKWQETTVESAKKNFTNPDGNQNIGLLTGNPSKIIVVDIDKDQLDRWNALIDEHGPIDTLTVKTGSGFHYYFHLTDRDHILRNGVKAPFDLRTTGGQVVAPYSIHGNGSTYKPIAGWEVDEDGEIEISLTSMPDWLYAMFCQAQR